MMPRNRTGKPSPTPMRPGPAPRGGAYREPWSQRPRGGFVGAAQQAMGGMMGGMGGAMQGQGRAPQGTSYEQYRQAAQGAMGGMMGAMQSQRPQQQGASMANLAQQLGLDPSQMQNLPYYFNGAMPRDPQMQQMPMMQQGATRMNMNAPANAQPVAPPQGQNWQQIVGALKKARGYQAG